ncbi:hypothetical protein TanjilG_08259 [Lupinus angustifolius]|uniref:Uncharacterized protein n=1 Tax=Lupinus angustifolius TaxID=3871 RepID=A0A1J7GK44_LUPAN|nr:PREDICTED: uncharacterized protein LOC109363096 [Lupinus angustifolius]OIW00820.1 hypothetical protein TanjilG_08259 [Lupinus angustifolius]
MFALKATHPSFNLANTNYTRLPNRRNSILCLCSSKTNESDSQLPEGDAQKQELLARIAMIQTQKVRLTDYLDDRSEYLAQFGEEANAELDKIGEDALKGLDDASDRIISNIESQMIAFEESNELNRLEIQESENKLLEFEGQVEEERNEGLFFKSLGKKESFDKEKAKGEVENFKDVTQKNDGNKPRKNVYLFFIGLLSFGLVNSIASSSSTDWSKVAVLGAILVALLYLFINEQNKDNKKDNQ